ncbi:unnamed protein product [Clavelina lepadiformis]|uniref:Kazal-like domain-containing protein n=1 Tax=Clavelina lepadiformis TaxID=159417 RepID=A0ABP0FGF3_CLALP
MASFCSKGRFFERVPTKTNWMLIFILSVQLETAISFNTGKSTSEVADLTRNCARNPSKPSTVFNAGNPCDASSNCRFGGICERFSSHDVITQQETCQCSWKCPRRSRINPEEHYVCGSDGRTYTSECKLKLAACRCQYPIEVKWKGPCERGPRIDSIPYLNDMMIPLDTDGSGSGDDVATYCDEGVTCKFGGVCDVDSEDGPCLCRMECEASLPFTVCGSDGRTYHNECYMKKASCKRQTDIKLTHVGSCLDPEVPDILEGDSSGEGSGEFGDDEDIYSTTACRTLNCEGDYIKPVCGSDGVDYANLCSLRFTACIMRTPLKVLHPGYCSPQDRLSVGATDAPLQEESPCDVVYCLYGAVCIPKGSEDFECSCDDICSEDSLMAQQNSLAHLGGIQMNHLEEFLPEIGRQLRFDEEQELYETNQDIMSSTTTTTASTTTTDDVIGDEPLIDSLDDVAELQQKLIMKNGRKIYIGDDSDFLMDRSMRRHRNNKDGKRRRPRRSIQTQLYINETVCGNDGKSYKDECQMRVHACHEKKSIKINKIGACPIPVNTRNPSSESAHNEKTKSFSETTTAIEPEKFIITTISSSKASDVTGLNFDLVTDASPPRNYDVSTTDYDVNDNSADSELVKFEPEVATKKNESLLGPGVQVSEAHAMEYSWLIAVAVMAQLLIIGAVVGVSYVTYRKTQNKKNVRNEPKIHKTESVTTSTGTLTTQASSEGEAV